MRAPRLHRAARQRGFTLVELMISLVLGALVVLAATAMVVASRATYRTQDETTRLAETARAGLELGNRLVRLAGYTNFGESQSPPAAYSKSATWILSPDSYSLDGPNIVGSSNSVPGGGSGLNGSDSLTVRFYGSGTPNGDGNVLDCAGFAVPVPAQNSAAYAQSRSYNVLFVENDTDGEPALKCQRQTYDATTGVPGAISASQTLIRGVEDLQVLYGEAIPQTVPACPAASALPDNTCDLDLYPPATVVYRSGIGGGANAVANWANVASVRISMLVRSGTGALPVPEPTTKTYDLFGANYAATVSDVGSSLSLSSMSVADRTRARRVVSTTIFLRNRVASWPSLDSVN